ncbi:hypothetical protein NL501_28845, partial [Klebsiella pneumoniae]|nr:hypothetical protein [Klebsiella pneumoniae]
MLLNEITTINPNEIVTAETVEENLKQQMSLATETLTVVDDITNQDYPVNQVEDDLMHRAVQVLLDYIHHTQKRNLDH